MSAKHSHPLHEMPEENHQPRPRQRMDSQRPVRRHQVPRERSHPRVPNDGRTAHHLSQRVPVGAHHRSPRHLHLRRLHRPCLHRRTTTGPRAHRGRRQRQPMDSQAPPKDEEHVQHPPARHSLGYSPQVRQLPRLPKEESPAPRPLQPKDEQLPERNRRPLHDQEELDHTYGAALVRDLCVPRQWCEHRERGQDARSLQYQDDAALCPRAGFLHPARYE